MHELAGNRTGGEGQFADEAPKFVCEKGVKTVDDSLIIEKAGGSDEQLSISVGEVRLIFFQN